MQNTAAHLLTGVKETWSYHTNSTWAPLAPCLEAYNLQNFADYFQVLKQSGTMLSISKVIIQYNLKPLQALRSSSKNLLVIPCTKSYTIWQKTILCCST